MIPSRRLLTLIATWLLLAVWLLFARVFSFTTAENIASLANAWWIAGLALGIAMLIDGLQSKPGRTIEAKRELNTNLPVGVATQATLTLKHSQSRTLNIQLLDQHDQHLRIPSMPIDLQQFEPGKDHSLTYSLSALKRGDNQVGPLIARITSPLGLWRHQANIAEAQPIKVYPNYAPVIASSHIGLEQEIRRLGIHLSQRRGSGMEFKQLREFIEGDELKQIDWKATAKERKPISREYQDERDQDIYFLLDCGRRLRHKDGDLSHFDTSMNAILLSAYIALRQGDGTGFMSFAGEPRWLTPVKGPSGINTLLNQLYDLHSSTQNTDFLKAAEEFMQRVQKRALVILISNVRDEDKDDLIAAAKLLKKKHIVVVASLRENFYDETLATPVADFDSALRYAETHYQMDERQKTLKQLRAIGLSILDCTPKNLHFSMVEEYFRIKRSGNL